MSNHEEFPELAVEAIAAYRDAFPYAVDPDHDRRRNLSAFLREAMKQAGPPEMSVLSKWDNLAAIHRSFHNPPPPPPTLAEAREADLSTPEGRITVVTFLASLAAETQP